LTDIKKLKRLDLAFNEITQIEADSFNALVNLVHLLLQVNRLEESIYSNLLQNLKKLILNLVMTKILFFPKEVFQNMKRIFRFLYKMKTLISLAIIYGKKTCVKLIVCYECFSGLLL
jgi:Leucine-rich repeat (LRR) protein